MPCYALFVTGGSFDPTIDSNICSNIFFLNILIKFG